MYNDILNEIIVKHSYNIYLGDDEEKIFKRYVHESADSVNIRKDVIKLHNKLFRDSSRFCTVFLDTLLESAFNSLLYYETNTNDFSHEFVTTIEEFSQHGYAIIDSINTPQKKYSANHFKVCVADIKSIQEVNMETEGCYIGKITFSKLVLNSARDKALLYYELKCGGLCGYGSLIVVEKNDTFWTIKKSLQTWIS